MQKIGEKKSSGRLPIHSTLLKKKLRKIKKKPHCALRDAL